MSLATVILLLVRSSIVLTVFSIGLETSSQDATYLFRRPGLLLRSLLSMYIVMPLVAVLLAAPFNLHQAVKIGLIALALSPVPPLLPRKTVKAAGEASYPIGLFVAASMLAIVWIPVALNLLGRVFEMPVHMPVATIVKLVVTTVLAPLAAGILVRSIAPPFSDRIANPLALAALVLLVISILPVLFTAWRAIASLIGNGTMLALAVFILAGLAVGHLLGGPKPGDRSVLALSTASRHPAVAMAIATINFPEQKLVPAAVLLYLVICAILSALYLKWVRRQHGGRSAAV